MKSWLVWGVVRGTAWLPLPLLHAVGQFAGRLLAIFPNRLRSTAAGQIRLCFPEQQETARQQLMRDSLAETGKTLTETGALWLRPASQALRLIRTVEGRELVDQALAQGRGVILATPHLGAWEAAGLYGAAEFHMSCLYRPLRLAKLEQRVRQARERAGASYVPTSASGIRRLYRALEAGRVVALLPDQEPRPGSGVVAPFFGIPAWSSVLLGRMARRTGAPVVFAWCERLPHGRGYRLLFRAAGKDIDAADPEVAATAMNRALEELVCECPAQYQWGYRRFKRMSGEGGITCIDPG